MSEAAIKRGPVICHLNFSEALEALKRGHTIMRPHQLVTDAVVMVDGIVMFKASRKRVHGFPVSCLMAEDWMVIA